MSDRTAINPLSHGLDSTRTLPKMTPLALTGRDPTSAIEGYGFNELPHRLKKPICICATPHARDEAQMRLFDKVISSSIPHAGR